MTFFTDGKPDQPFEVIGAVETHVPSNAFFNPKADLENGGYAELRKRACALGGNGVIIHHYIESQAVEFSHVHIWAILSC